MQVFREIRGIELPVPFPRLTYAEAMDRYGSDRPDLRFKMELANVSFSICEFKKGGLTLKRTSTVHYFKKWLLFLDSRHESFKE